MYNYVTMLLRPINVNSIMCSLQCLCGRSINFSIKVLGFESRTVAPNRGTYNARIVNVVRMIRSGFGDDSPQQSRVFALVCNRGRNMGPSLHA